MTNVCWKVKFLAKNDQKVTDSIREDKMTKDFNDQAPKHLPIAYTTTGNRIK